MAKLAAHILDMARKGADHRYQELKSEIAALVKNFPHLAAKARMTTSRVGAEGMAAVQGGAKQVRRRARKMSAEARKAVSDRMKKYWAAKRKTKKA
jgi:hypothetical protein